MNEKLTPTAESVKAAISFFSPTHSIPQKEKVGKNEMKPHKGALPKLTPLYQSSPLVERPRADESDENFLIVPHNESEIPGSAGDVTLTVQALQKQVNKALKIVLKPTVQQILYFFRNT